MMPGFSPQNPLSGPLVRESVVDSANCLHYASILHFVIMTIVMRVGGERGRWTVLLCLLWKILKVDEMLMYMDSDSWSCWGHVAHRPFHTAYAQGKVYPNRLSSARFPLPPPPECILHLFASSTPHPSTLGWRRTTVCIIMAIHVVVQSLSSE